MATDFAPVFEKKFHDKVVPGLLMVLDDNANPRVQAHAGNDFICLKFFLSDYGIAMKCTKFWNKPIKTKQKFTSTYRFVPAVRHNRNFDLILN